MRLYLLGGRPCSGKTTLAYNLGKKYNIDVEYLDVFAQECINKSTPKTPNIYRWKNKDIVEVLQKNPRVLFDEYIRFYEEVFPLFIKHLERLEQDQIILEASLLLPKFTDVLKESFEITVCYLITDDDFVREQYLKRDYVIEMISKPKGREALNNLLERDSLFAKYINSELEKYLLPSLQIKTEVDIKVNIKNIERILGLDKNI